MKIQLRKPISHKGQQLKELDIPLEELTGLDLLDVEKQVCDPDDTKLMLLPEYSKKYLIAVAARAAHIPAEVLHSLSAKDFTAVSIGVRNFLTGADSGTEGLALEEEVVTPELASATSSKG